MKKVGIRFKRTGKLSFYITDNDDIHISDSIVADTEKGEEIGVVAKILDFDEKEELTSIKRIATDEDFKVQKDMDDKIRIRYESFNH